MARLRSSAAIGRQPAGEAVEVARLQIDLALAGELHDQAFAGEERLLDPAHAADAVVEGRLPGEEVARIDREAAVDLFLDDAAVGRVEELPRAAALDEECTLPGEERLDA